MFISSYDTNLSSGTVFSRKTVTNDEFITVCFIKQGKDTKLVILF